jgi:hypothetical protein
MMNEILKKYSVEFFKSNILGRYVIGLTSVNLTLSQYISDWDTVIDAELVLQAIDQILNGEKNRITNISNSLVAIDMNICIAKFYDDLDFDESTTYFSLPILDFKEILVAWKEFLSSNI